MRFSDLLPGDKLKLNPKIYKSHIIKNKYLLDKYIQKLYKDVVEVDLVEKYNDINVIRIKGDSVGWSITDDGFFMDDDKEGSIYGKVFEIIELCEDN